MKLYLGVKRFGYLLAYSPEDLIVPWEYKLYGVIFNNKFIGFSIRIK